MSIKKFTIAGSGLKAKSLALSVADAYPKANVHLYDPSFPNEQSDAFLDMRGALSLLGVRTTTRSRDLAETGLFVLAAESKGEASQALRFAVPDLSRETLVVGLSQGLKEDAELFLEALPRGWRFMPCETAPHDYQVGEGFSRLPIRMAPFVGSTGALGLYDYRNVEAFWKALGTTPKIVSPAEAGIVQAAFPGDRRAASDVHALFRG